MPTSCWDRKQKTMFNLTKELIEAATACKHGVSYAQMQAEDVQDPETTGERAGISARPDLSARQLEIVRHALGVKDGKPGYRNHFCTGAGSDDFADCETLAAGGVMERHTRSFTPDFIYTVIDPQAYLPREKAEFQP